MKLDKYIVGIQRGSAQLRIFDEEFLSPTNLAAIIVLKRFSERQDAENWKDHTKSQIDTYNRVHGCTTCDD